MSRTEVDLGEATLELEMIDGVLNVWRDGEFEGSMLVIEPEPDIIDAEIVEPVEQSELAANLPPGWYRDGDVLMMNADWNEETQSWEGGEPVNSPALG